MRWKFMLLPLLLMITLTAPVQSATSVLFDDSWDGWSGGTVTTDDYYYGINSYKCTAAPWSGVVYTFPSVVDWSSYSYINFYYKSAVPIVFKIQAPDNSNYWVLDLPAQSDWTLKTFSTDEMTVGAGSPSNATIYKINVYATFYSGTFYTDYIWLSGSVFQSLEITYPDDGTVIVAPDATTYVEGQPVHIIISPDPGYQLVRTMLNNTYYTSENDFWLLMNNNYTLTPIIREEPAVDYQPAYLMLVVLFATLLISMLFYFKGIPVFVMLSSILGFLFNVISLSNSSIPFTPYLQMLFMLIQLTLLIDSTLKIRR